MFKPRYKQLIAKAGHYSVIACIFSHCIFSSASEKCTDTYGSILLPRSTLLAVLLCLDSYKQWSTWLYWKCYIHVVTWTCSGFYWYILSALSLGHAVCPQDHAYISVKPLTAVLQPINVHITAYICHDIIQHWTSFKTPREETVTDLPAGIKTQSSFTIHNYT